MRRPGNPGRAAHSEVGRVAEKHDDAEETREDLRARESARSGSIVSKGARRVHRK